MILDNSGIDYSRMLLFVFGFLVYWEIEPNSRAPATPGLRLDYKSVMSKLSKKSDFKEHIFKGFITINNISTPFLNWKIAAIIFVSVIDYY